jgi:hypothetical protein
MFKTKMFKCIVTMVIVLFVISACAGSPPSDGTPKGDDAKKIADAQALAQGALNRMDGGAGGGVGQPATNNPSAQQQKPAASTPAPAPEVVVNTGRNKPAWVDNPEGSYARNRYVTGVGNGSNRTMAERNALANLTAFFGQSIQADTTSRDIYREAVNNGKTQGWSTSYQEDTNIKTQAKMDSLYAADIREVWHDQRNNAYYAIAAMEKSRAAQIYSDMIIANQDMIKNLINMTAAEKNSMDGFSRYRFAAAVADINTSYVNLLNIIEVAPPPGHVRGDVYRLEARDISKNIPINITVKNDKAGRIQGAFAKALSELGFMSGSSGSRYALNVDITTEPVTYPPNPRNPNAPPMFYTRIELTANLTDRSMVLVPYNFSLRPGALNQANADNTAYQDAEKKINEEYGALLDEHLSQLIPQR